MRKNILRFGCAILWLAVAAVAMSGTASAQPKLARDLDSGSSENFVSVIVQFTSAPTQRHHDKVRRRGGAVEQELALVNAGLYKIKAKELAFLAADPEVSYISPDRALTSSMEFANPTVGANIARQYGYDGEG
ncbi:MAG TPA: hypothetical protein VFL57_18630, partial [Bryobacteraceae bacterium]|nr:hypothetical protein [Bryobacteraceae bacterium]